MELIWRNILRDVMAEHQALRDRLAVALWELRRARRDRRMDDQVAWRLGELERKMTTWEGD